ncbi:uncharacterized protein MONOS_5841 [Monocercomonoides exilis]|uniref:uncharacterized protein n=1 Tax=Monocercomonoides exilis TaxID=2049356 RepID=UPI00355A3794|nr:hypothetical protein MONOS_5841 [Monocercomonoides exilis]|eukprot:MONOS_5841.1-p1 / transcript=MONOS_5841.1 / gene=MONOS_5841 / organism=Monocercomonoides_exilis_PA203 / gene_product=unspecified product / transcript_product=unspecified product / location=Mono_scaffold00175:71693-71947(-) / protein_length=85 / sequence_SO=supercontig / SO=protein_coding / is_pseudo=false
MDKKTNFDEKSAITQPSCLKDTNDLQRELDVLCNRVAQIKKQLEDATGSKNEEDENLNVMKKEKVTIVKEEDSIFDMKKSEKRR